MAKPAKEKGQTFYWFHGQKYLLVEQPSGGENQNEPKKKPAAKRGRPKKKAAEETSSSSSDEAETAEIANLPPRAPAPRRSAAMKNK